VVLLVFLNRGRALCILEDEGVSSRGHRLVTRGAFWSRVVVLVCLGGTQSTLRSFCECSVRESGAR